MRGRVIQAGQLMATAFEKKGFCGLLIEVPEEEMKLHPENLIFREVVITPTDKWVISSSEELDKKESNEPKYARAIPILEHANKLSGKNFRKIESNLRVILARLNEPGVTHDGIIEMLNRMWKVWGQDPQMEQYFRPETLFRPSKFDAYYANRNMPINRPSDGANGAARNAGIAGGDEWRREFDAQYEPGVKDDSLA